MVIEQAVFNMLTEMNNLPSQNCARLVSAKAPSAPEDTAKPVRTSRKPIELTPPPATVSATQSKESVMLDPFTGEVVPLGANSNPNTASAPQQEVTKLNGLFSPAGAGNGTETESRNTREMQEKLLWGNRPVLR